MNIFNKIVSTVLRNRIVVLVLSTSLFIYGAYVTVTSPVDVLPDLNRPSVTIFTEAPGMAAEEVETLVSRPIETVMNGATGVERVRSVSANGLSLVFVEFQWSQNIYIARQIVSEKLQSTKLPDGAESKLGAISSIMGEIQLVGLTRENDTITLKELRNLADWVVKPKLLTVSGISQVTVLGGELQEYQVRVNPVKLSNINMTITQLEAKLQGVIENKSGGFISTDTVENPIRIIGRTNDVKTIGDTVIGKNGEILILLKDIATVEIGSQVNPRGDASINGQSGVLLSIKKQPGANTLELTKRVDEALASIGPGLGKGIALHPDLFKQEKFISTGIENLIEVTRDAAIMVIIVLILFLGNWRAMGITLFALPFSFVSAILILKFFGIDINVMTLGGLAVAIGELTDDAVVDVENTIRWFRENKKKSHPLSTFQVVLQASSEVRGSIVFSTALIVIVFLPLLALSNVEGKLLAPLAIAYIVALLASTVVAMTVTAVMCYYLIPNSALVEREKETVVVRFFKKIAEPIIRWNIQRPLVSIGIIIVSTLLTGVLFVQAGKEFLPPFNEGSLTINVSLPPGTSLPQSNGLGTAIEKAILKVDGVQTVARRTGRAEDDEHANEVNVSEFEVDIDIHKRSKNEIIADIKKQMETVDLKEASVSIGQPISHRIEHVLSGVRAPIVIKLFGGDLNELEVYANKIRNILENIPGTLNPVVEQEINVPQIQVVPKRERLAAFGFEFNDFTEIVEVAFSGKEIGRVIADNKNYKLVLRLDEQSTADPARIGQLLIRTPNGMSVPLSTLAEIKYTEGRNSISHDNGQRRLVISSGILGGDSVTIIETLKKKVEKEIQLPQGYFLNYEGTYQSQQESSRSLLILGILSFIGILGVLFYKFRSFSLIFQVLVNIPVTYLGALIAIAITGNVINLASLVGLISLLGLGARNGILLIEHWLFMGTEERMKFGTELIVKGSLNRLSPMLITSFSAMLALIPIIIFPDKPGLEMLHPIAVTIFGGLLTSTLVEIVIRPAMFSLFGKKPLEKAAAHNEENSNEHM